MSSGEEYTSPETGQGRQKAGGRKRRTASAVSGDQEPQDDTAAQDRTVDGDRSAERELDELLQLRQALVRIARDIIVTLGVDPDESSMPGPGLGPRARGMGGPGMMGRRMRRGGAYRDGPGPMRRMPPPGPRGYPGMGGPGGMGPPGGPAGPGARRRRGGRATDEDEDR